jgi:hypothetical protein
MAPWLVYTNVYLYYLKPRLGDYVIVGVHNDAIVNQRRGMNLPIMNMHERVLSVLGCKVRRLCDMLLCLILCSALTASLMSPIGRLLSPSGVSSMDSFPAKCCMVELQDSWRVDP